MQNSAVGEDDPSEEDPALSKLAKQENPCIKISISSSYIPKTESNKKLNKEHKDIPDNYMSPPISAHHMYNFGSL